MKDPTLWHRCAAYYATFTPNDDDRVRPIPQTRTPIPYALTASELQADRRGL